LIAGEYPKHLATPDGLSSDHRVIAEVKTTGKDWGVVEKLPLKYARQVQWQLHVTGAEFAVVAWLLRVEEDGAFVPGWWKPKVGVMERDREMIANLDGCVNCNFPTPSVFVNEDDLLFCRRCRMSGEDGALV